MWRWSEKNDAPGQADFFFERQLQTHQQLCWWRARVTAADGPIGKAGGGGTTSSQLLPTARVPRATRGRRAGGESIGVQRLRRCLRGMLAGVKGGRQTRQSRSDR